MSDVKNPLEMFIEAKFKELDPKTHRTSGSGCGNQKGDIANKFCAVECKIKRSNKNITMNYDDEWVKTNNQMATGTNKFPIVAIQNKYGENFIVLSADDFFKLMKDANDIK